MSPRISIDEIVIDLIRQHEGGENFFNALDEIIRSDITLVVQLLQLAIEKSDYLPPILVSGKFGRVFANTFADRQVIVVNGDLRKGKPVDDLSYLPILKNEKFIFIDDSFYSGRTRKAIQKELDKYGAKIVTTFVVYDGSKTKDETVHSLYRFHA